MSVNLATMLREGTKKAHTMAENMGFVKCFLRGVVEKNSYRKLTANFYYVYSAMEEEMERLHKLEHPVISKMYFPELNRKATLEQDLAYYYGPQWRTQIKISPVGQEYVDRIRSIAHERPELLLSHHYTRYIGDLSGGQILKKIAMTAMKLEEGEGVAFYEFPGIPDEKAFKDNYRAVLDTLPIDQATGEDIVEEANDSFDLNMRMFEELEGNLVKAIGTMLFNSLTRRRSRGSTEGNLATAK